MSDVVAWTVRPSHLVLLPYVHSCVSVCSHCYGYTENASAQLTACRHTEFSRGKEISTGCPLLYRLKTRVQVGRWLSEEAYQAAEDKEPRGPGCIPRKTPELGIDKVTLASHIVNLSFRLSWLKNEANLLPPAEFL